ncbi:hypothetical protein EBZ35_07995 [bacterium]|nr:hypothetical protein [bacterium]
MPNDWNENLINQFIERYITGEELEPISTRALKEITDTTDLTKLIVYKTRSNQVEVLRVVQYNRESITVEENQAFLKCPVTRLVIDIDQVMSYRAFIETAQYKACLPSQPMPLEPPTNNHALWDIVIRIWQNMRTESSRS